jgi:hypothetical protein
MDKEKEQQKEAIEKETRRRNRIAQLTKEIIMIRAQLTRVYMNVK